MLKKSFFEKNYLRCVLAVLMTLTMNGLGIAVAFLLRRIVDTVTSNDSSEIKWLIILVASFVIGFFILSITRTISKYCFIASGLSKYRERFVENVILNGDNDEEDKSDSSYRSVIYNDTETIRIDYLSGSLLLIYNFTIIIITIVIMLITDYLVAIITIIFSIAPLFISIIMSSRVSNNEKILAKEKEHFSENIDELLAGRFVFNQYGVCTPFISRFVTANRRIENIQCRRDIVRDFSSISAMTLSYAAIFFIYMSLGYQTIKGRSTVGTIMLFVQLSNYILGPVVDLTEIIPKWKASKFLIAKAEALCKESVECKPHISSELDVSKIELKNITYSYSDSCLAIDGVNLTFYRNQSYVIMGENGSGKSTLLKIMAGQKNSYVGSVIVNGTDLKEIQHKTYVNNIAYIPQEDYIFNDSIINNITLFREIGEDELKIVLKETGLDKVIEQKGEMFLCGFGGEHLSGGEKQRVVLARAMVSNRDVIFADEPNSALDSSGSNLLFEYITGQTNKMSIVVTHNISDKQLQRFDAIIVLEKGRVAFNGNYDEYMEWREMSSNVVVL